MIDYGSVTIQPTIPAYPSETDRTAELLWLKRPFEGSYAIWPRREGWCKMVLRGTLLSCAGAVGTILPGMK